MNWYELLEKHNERAVDITALHFSSASLEKYVRYNEAASDIYGQIQMLGDNLTIEDLPTVIWLCDMHVFFSRAAEEMQRMLREEGIDCDYNRPPKVYIKTNETKPFIQTPGTK